MPSDAPPERLLDCRGMEPPEPMVQVLDAVDALGAEDELVMLMDREPVPLYAILARNGFRHSTRYDGNGTWAIHIRRKCMALPSDDPFPD